MTNQNIKFLILNSQLLLNHCTLKIDHLKLIRAFLLIPVLFQLLQTEL